MQTSVLPSNLPPQLLQALNDLDVVPQGSMDDPGDDFWLRLATQLERFDEVAAVLPEDMDVNHLAAWLAVGLSGEGLPEDGKDLPLPPGLVLVDALRAGGAALHQGPVPPGSATGPVAAAAHLVEGWEQGLLRARAGDTASELRQAGGLPPIDPDMQSASRAAFVAGMQDATSRFWGGAASLAANGIAELAGLSARVSENAAQTLTVPVPAAAMAAAESASGPQASSANPLAPRAFNLDVPLQQPGWDRAFGNGIRWMVNQNVQLAEIRVSPPNLGPIEVRLQVEGDRTHLNIVAPHATTREAVEAALPRLREMFAESGLNLGDVNVRQDNAGRGGSEADERARLDSASTTGGDDDARVGQAPAETAHAGRGLVDFYA